MQPGSILVHWESLRYSGCSVLGILTIIATLVSMLYTTAAEALVAPKLVWGPVENRILVGDVYTTFANYGYLADNCMSVLPVDADSLNRNVTCLQIQYLGPSYSDYQAFTRAWRLEPEKDLPLPTTLEFRPPPTAWIQESGITAIGSWIDRVDNAAVSQKYGRFVQNVTVAMPHANILAAMDHPANGLTQGNSPSNRGSYEVEASVMSPALNVLCAGMNASELAPIVYTEWPDKGGNFDPETWEINPPADLPGRGDGEWNNRTAVDELFGFGPDYPNTTTVAPIFGTLPMPNMTAVNVTTDYVSNAIYLLGASPPGRKPEYVLCSLKAHYSPQCSTRYKVTPSGSEFSAFCEQGNRARYGALHPSMDRPIWAPDWRFVAVHWMYGMSLDSGVRNKKSTSSWLLTKLVPTMPSLPPNRPSISEALAVLAGNTLMLSAVNASFAPFANWTRTAASSRVDRPIAESFNATVRQLVYASGGTQPWQGVFYPILLFAFAISVLCLVFMVLGIRGNPITDFTEPQNLFTLAVNSPSTSKMEGACGSGPDGEQLGEKWHVSMQEQDEHYYIQFKEDHQEAKDTKGPLIWETESAIELIEDGHERLIRSSQATREYRKLALRKTWEEFLDRLDGTLHTSLTQMTRANGRTLLFDDNDFTKSEQYFAALQILHKCNDWIKGTLRDFKELCQNTTRELGFSEAADIPDEELEDFRALCRAFFDGVEVHFQPLLDRVERKVEELFNATSVKEASKRHKASREQPPTEPLYLGIHRCYGVLSAHGSFFGMHIFDPNDVSSDSQTPFIVTFVVLNVATYVTAACALLVAREDSSI
ncbi:hypothetical protein BDW74DRAFT_177377 [Aspergillus multicolor]|uniref:uncharacterized protein n=1 Tax=Aspergillus multicolor TaxID=41759 RepID=UPI003CCCFBAA